MTCPLQPLSDRVIVKPHVRKMSDILYVVNNEKMNEGRIVAVGPAVREVRVGEFIKYGNGTYLDWPIQHIDGVDYQIIQEADICMVVDD